MEARPGITKATYPIVFTLVNRVLLEHLPPKLPPVLTPITIHAKLHTDAPLLPKKKN